MMDTRCGEHHPESWWFDNKRCDKAVDHRGKHVYQARTLFGPDPSTFTYWDAAGSVTYINREVRKAFLAEIDARFPE